MTGTEIFAAVAGSVVLIMFTLILIDSCQVFKSKRKTFVEEEVIMIDRNPILFYIPIWKSMLGGNFFMIDGKRARFSTYDQALEYIRHRKFINS